MSAALRGAYPMVVTPFGDDGALELGQIAPIVAHQLAAGCPGVSALGLAGEASELGLDERHAVAREVIAAAGPGRAIIGCSAERTDDARALALAAAGAGAAAIMLAPPAGGVDPARHYEEIARAVAPVPVVVQDAPAFLSVSLGASFVEALMARCPNVRHVKPEPVLAVDGFRELAAVPGLTVLGGKGGMFLPDELAAGATGTIPGPEAPAMHQGVIERFATGDEEGARTLHERLLPLLALELQGLAHYVRCVKEVLVAQGLLRSAHARLGGLPPLGDDARALLLATAARAGVLS